MNSGVQNCSSFASWSQDVGAFDLNSPRTSRAPTLFLFGRFHISELSIWPRRFLFPTGYVIDIDDQFLCEFCARNEAHPRMLSWHLPLSIDGNYEKLHISSHQRPNLVRLCIIQGRRTMVIARDLLTQPALYIHFQMSRVELALYFRRLSMFIIPSSTLYQSPQNLPPHFGGSVLDSASDNGLVVSLMAENPSKET